METAEGLRTGSERKSRGKPRKGCGRAVEARVERERCRSKIGQRQDKEMR